MHHCPPRHRRYWACGLIVALLVLVVQAHTVPAQPVPAAVLATHAQQSMAVAQTVLSIISYTQWPKQPEPLHLCIVGDTVWANALLRDKLKIGSTDIVAQRHSLDDPGIGTACNVVYVGPISPAERFALFQRLSGHAVLSISEANRTCSVGSMFCLSLRRSRVAFKVNLDSVARSGVSVDPQVLLLSASPEGQQP